MKLDGEKRGGVAPSAPCGPPDAGAASPGRDAGAAPAWEEPAAQRPGGDPCCGPSPPDAATRGRAGRAGLPNRRTLFGRRGSQGRGPAARCNVLMPLEPPARDSADLRRGCVGAVLRLGKRSFVQILSCFPHRAHVTS